MSDETEEFEFNHISPFAKDRINQARLETIYGGFTYGGMTFDTDQFSTELIRGQVLEALVRRELTLPDEKIVWHLGPGQDIELTVDGFLHFFVAFSQFVRGAMLESFRQKENL